MTLQTRLVVSFSILLLVVIAAVGLVATQSVERVLIDQIDNALLRFEGRGRQPNLPQGFRPPTDEEFLRPVGEIFIDANGSMVEARPSGFTDDPDPLPDLTTLPEESGLLYLDSVDNSLRYRASIAHLEDGTTIVRVIPLDDFAGATSALIRTLLIAGGGVLLVGGAVTWWTVRRAMAPIEEMVETAEAIAAGDLTQRVPDRGTENELGRLGVSLNEMLGHIEKAVDTEREAKERLRRFVADASHELRTPIATIAGYSELRRHGGLSDAADEDRAWGRVESESLRMAALIEDLLTLARLGQGQPLQIEPADVVQLTRDAVDDHRVMAPDRPITLDSPETVVVGCDAGRIFQVVTSLLSNARAHTPPGTSVEVEIIEANESVELSVTDSGPGIPTEALPHVFERFYRADSSRSRKSGGSGLGLAIVEAIISAHAGEVTASNVKSGGARITFTIPTRVAARTRSHA